MSDLFQVRQKVEEGANWRGDITIAMDGEQKTLTVRQLRDPEYWEVMSLVNTDEIEELQDNLPEDKMERLKELRDKDEDLTDEEEEVLQNLQNEIEEEDVNMFDIISYETFQGIQQAAKYGTEADPQDVQRVLTEHGGEIAERYGAASDENARKWANDHIIAPMIDRCTNFTSFTIGVKVLAESIGDEGNLES